MTLTNPSGTLPGMSPDVDTAPPNDRAGRARRAITWALGAIWLLDAALQFQPYMFTRDFPADTLQPTGQGSPGWVSSPVTWAAHLMEHHIVFWNALFALVQLAIAVAFFSRRTLKVAIAASVLWSLGVWWLGEGLGGVLAGPVSPLMGLPGAVIIYALIAVFVWPRDPASGGSVATGSPLRAAGAKALWVLLWGSFVFESLRAANRSPSALGGMVSGMSDGEPGWIKTIDRWGTELLGQRGTEFSIGLAVLLALVTFGVLLPSLTRPAIVVAVALAALIWVFGENFGQIATGNATDPNSGPLLALFALCYWPTRRGGTRGAVDVRD